MFRWELNVLGLALSVCRTKQQEKQRFRLTRGPGPVAAIHVYKNEHPFVLGTWGWSGLDNSTPNLGDLFEWADIVIFAYSRAKK